MSVRDFIQQLEEQGASFYLNGDKVKVSAPPEIITPAIRQTLAQYKPDLLAYLKKNQDLSSETSDYWREIYEERVAIRRHDGELPMEEASYLARWETLHQFVVEHHPNIMAAFESAINQPVRH